MYKLSSLKMDDKSFNHKRIFRQICNFCSGDHLMTIVQFYATVIEKKQVLKRLRSCYVCIKRESRAFRCLLTKKTCYFCKKGKLSSQK